ncbi:MULTISPECIES: AAA family ATPase [unclassified Coleofasciculus]|uniref:AAA family ATPase n=1 Tax=unclassified Coleofasciculus TaxID=2692782 RepID=UPI001882C35E|nr:MULTISPECIES: AAA family ATPase [unclassified Coleofasciculus]MBE9128999.1 AAA family ATPase [Coleofasciculus sp. LEGE 07081]MBE9151578.1 AAA family ATPase [Coleofasciculus sp. LEGE 07092]
MIVKRLKINSFRGIGNLTLEFNQKEPTILVGLNGAGKSSILDCLAVLLSHFVAEIHDPAGTGRFINEQDVTAEQKVARRFFRPEDINNGAEKTQNEIAIVIEEREINWFIALSKLKERPRGGNVRELEGICLRIKNQLRNNPVVNLPLTVYYHVNREFCDDIPQHTSQQYWSKQLEVYERALTGARISFNSFFEWFKELEDVENEFRLDDPDYRNPQLEAVRQAISSLLPGFSNLRVRRTPLRMTVKKHDKELIIDQLSEGEKGLLAMAGDLARRLAIANPGLAAPLQGCGIILIDEIELHLHPAWQREIIPALTRTFPNCQFIVTTHSPQVISQVQPESIYLLEPTVNGIIARHPEPYRNEDNAFFVEELLGISAHPQDVFVS